VLAGLGLVMLVIGVDLALAWRDTSPLYVLAGVLLGGLAGELLGIEDRLAPLGDSIQLRVEPARGTPSLGERGVLRRRPALLRGAAGGGRRDPGRLTGDYEALATKAMLDGFASIALSATLGWGVALAAITVLVYQGALSLGATLFEDILQGDALDPLTSAGGVLIIGISLKLLDLTDVKVGNFLPALLFAPALVGIVSLVD